MNIPSHFDAIRPYEPEEVGRELQNLMHDEQFAQLWPLLQPLLGLQAEQVGQAMAKCESNLDFQRTFLYPFVQKITDQLTTGCDLDTSALADKTASYTFISNHRDIVLDSALLCKMLIESGFPDTVEIAIGDNLLVFPWIERLVRLNKAFIVRRSLPMREMLAASKLLSDYMHFAISQKHQGIWIAQREGRAKDSDDRTQEALLKMMAMGGEGTLAQRIASLHIVPLAISYEYDPCDYLKAKEFQLKRDVEGFRKSKQDDLDNMRTGIMGYKGAVHYEAAPCINSWLSELESLPKNEFFAELCRRIDREIHSRYRLYAGNYVALDLLEGSDAHAAHYSVAEKARFEEYLQSRVEKVDLPQRDDAFIRERILTMYANPARNYIKAHQ